MQCTTFLLPPPKKKDQNTYPSIGLAYEPIPCCSSCQIWLAMRYTTLVSDLSLVESFFQGQVLGTDMVFLFAKSRVEDCLEAVKLGV